MVYGPGENLGYHHVAVKGDFWHAGDYVDEIKEIMYYARLLETWLGHDPVTTLIIEDFPHTSPVWMRLSAKPGCWDTSVYGGTAPTIFDVADRVRGDALGLSSYSFSQRVPAYLNCIAARDELHNAIGALLSNLPSGEGQPLVSWRDYPGCTFDSYYELTWWHPYGAGLVLAPSPNPNRYEHGYTRLLHCVNELWCVQCSTVLFLSAGVNHSGDAGLHSTLRCLVYSGDPGVIPDTDLSDLTDPPSISSSGAAPTVYDLSADFGGLGWSEELHIYAVIEETCPYGSPSDPYTDTFGWLPPLSPGEIGYLWGVP